MASLSDPEVVAGDVEASLRTLEERLIGLIEQGRVGAAPDRLAEEAFRLAAEVRPAYRRLYDTLERRDCTFEVCERIRTLCRHALWLYRKCRLEHLFFSKLQIDRALRDALHRQAVQAFDEMSKLDDDERALMAATDESLAAELLDQVEGPREAREPSRQ